MRWAGERAGRLPCLLLRRCCGQMRCRSVAVDCVSGEARSCWRPPAVLQGWLRWCPECAVLCTRLTPCLHSPPARAQPEALPLPAPCRRQESCVQGAALCAAAAAPVCGRPHIQHAAQGACGCRTAQHGWAGGQAGGRQQRSVLQPAAGSLLRPSELTPHPTHLSRIFLDPCRCAPRRATCATRCTRPTCCARRGCRWMPSCTPPSSQVRGALPHRAVLCCAVKPQAPLASACLGAAAWVRPQAALLLSPPAPRTHRAPRPCPPRAACAVAGDAEQAFAQYAAMKADGITPDRMVYSSVVKACAETIDRLPPSERCAHLASAAACRRPAWGSLLLAGPAALPVGCTLTPSIGLPPMALRAGASSWCCWSARLPWWRMPRRRARPQTQRCGTRWSPPRAAPASSSAPST